MPKTARMTVGVAILSAGLVLAGCGRDYSAETSQPSPVEIQDPSGSPYQGVELEQPIAKPDVELQDTDGAPFNLARDTDGTVTLVYAGYTNCPDICPTTVADIAVALRGLPPQERERVRVVMFSTDPARDTPQRMRAFLDQFDSSFVGVLGEESALIGAINAMGIDVQPPTPAENGDLLVEHGAQVLAFTPPDNRAGLLWTSGTSAAEYRTDLQQLLSTNGNDQ